MPDPHEKKPEAEEVLDSEKEAQQEQDEAYAAEVPDISNALAVLATSSGLIINPLNERLKLIRAFRNVNRPDFSYNLLSSDPKKYFQAIKDHALVREEVNKQRKKAKKKGKTIDTVQTGLGPFSRFNAKISLNDFDHKDQAVKLASPIQNRIYASEVRNNIEATAKVYGLSLENKTNLARDFGQWLKANPDKDFEKFLKSRGQKYAADKKDFKVKAKRLKTELATSRSKALDAHSEQMIRAHIEFKELSDPKKPLLSEEELNARIDRTLHPEKTVSVTMTPVPEAAAATTTPSAPTTKTSSTTKVQTIPKSTVSATPIHRYSAPTPRPHLRIQALERFNIIQNQINQIQQKISQQIISRITESIKNTVIKSTEKIALKLASKATTKVIGAGIKQLLASALPGIGNAAMAILQLTGLDDLILKQVFKIALFAVAVPVGLLILMIFIAPNISREFGAGLSNAESVAVNNSTNTNEYSWKNFEEDVLGAQTNLGTVPFGDSPFSSNKGEWMQFEEEKLISEEDPSTSLGMTPLR